MGLWDKLKNELIDIIEWKDDSNNTMVWRFPRYQDEIKNGAQLTVRESQVAVFVNEGQIADVFKPGRYELTTQNMPILTTLRGWKYGFNSPFKVDIFFVNTKNFTDNKWGTKNPIMLRDAEFGPIRLRAFGSFAIKITDAGKFIKEIAGTQAHFTTDEVTEQLRNLVVTRFSDAIGESKIPVLDLAANYDELSKFISGKINPEFGEYGLEVTKFLVENISLPTEVEQALDKRSSMGILGNLNQYAQFQAANAMEAAAKNPGGDAGAGIGMGMGFAMAQQMGQAFNAQNQQQAPQGPPPIPGSNVQYFVAVNGQQQGPFNLAALQQMTQQGSLTRETLVWKQGMAGWIKASDTPDLGSLFGAIPPPLPPQ
ncbi:Membrane protease subunit, stomatin/prohibitin family, contains C-terminal Zn-ribbon domain [Chryseolinea serpens]|uniref:Membrane protease subunit, stomatin/prohibitin family, contains C-terminal Zn-ribbon domain n=1 Tax=Chryseolinea serpens TaxID=947013 RepID=A0A1M5WMN5_9BACT|nr:SPFH domain-containing protein [Chryseolinea serpens]SHH88806.1 Membrane protease subunit, stomatin/prohibitin family, contains C-terminal Zn-ribbon domain [Chryseolinea serpens]